MADKFMNQDRTSEFWAAIKTALAGKVDLAKLDEYPTVDAMATAIATALVDYAKSADVTEEINQKITDALVEYVTQTQMNEAIAEAIKEVSGITVSVVNVLPEQGEENVIYLVPSKSSTEKNVRDEYMWIDGKWELIGSTAVDLTNYWSKDELAIMTEQELKEILV